VRKACEELRCLLNWGYPKQSALEFVSNHHKLLLEERNILARTVFPDQLAADLKRRRVDPREVRGKELGIDGYNVLITVESMVEGKTLFLCDDGWVRDVSAVFGRHRITPTTQKALAELLNLLDQLKPSWFEFLFEKQVSWSGRLAELVRREIDKRELDGTAKTVSKVDSKLKGGYEFIATSDHAIILKHYKVLDLPSLLVERLGTQLLRM